MEVRNQRRGQYDEVREAAAEYMRGPRKEARVAEGERINEDLEDASELIAQLIQLIKDYCDSPGRKFWLSLCKGDKLITDKKLAAKYGFVQVSN